MSHLRIFGHYVHTPYLVMAACEAVIVGAAAYVGRYLRYHDFPVLWDYLLPASTFAATVVASMLAMGVYESRIREGYIAMMLRTGVAIFPARIPRDRHSLLCLGRMFIEPRHPAAVRRVRLHPDRRLALDGFTSIDDDV